MGILAVKNTERVTTPLLNGIKHSEPYNKRATTHTSKTISLTRREREGLGSVNTDRRRPPVAREAKVVHDLMSGYGIQEDRDFLSQDSCQCEIFTSAEE